MAAQFLPILKAIAPYIAQVAAAAIPAFTSKKEAANREVVKSDPVVANRLRNFNRRLHIMRSQSKFLPRSCSK